MTIADNIKRIQTAKADIRSAIIAKGGEVSESATLDTYASAIEALPSGGGGFDFSQMTGTSSMFADSTAKSLDLTGLDTSNVKTMTYMFYNMRSLETLDLTGLDTSSATTFQSMFSNLRAITELDASMLDTSSLTSLYRTFDTCSNLVTLDISGWDTSKVATTQYMFTGCTRLVTLKANFNFAKVTNTTYMFLNCIKLATIDGTWSNISVNISANQSPLTRESALVIIKGLAGTSACTLTLKESTYNLLTDDDWDLVPDNWEIAYQ